MSRQELTNIKNFIKEQLCNSIDVEQLVNMVEDKYFLPKDSIRWLIKQVNR